MNVLLDTSIIVEYGVDGIKDFIANDNRVFLSDIVLQEMDGHKNSEEAKGYNAREFFRQMGNAKIDKANLDITIKQNDYISKHTLSNRLELYTIVRNKYNSRDINDSKIIEIAKDYDLKLITRDIAQSVRANAMGAEVEVV
ncbi:PIN domain-containing protein, partial [Campylobacter fetus]|uniref:PIN domain-containing protein n=1 Tax=Campylobacter fetus TaxID=196 RepID=UPI00112F8D2C